MRTGLTTVGQAGSALGMPDQAPTIHAVEESGTTAWQAGDEDRVLDTFVQRRRCCLFFLAKPQRVGEEAQYVPAGRHPPEQPQIGLASSGIRQTLERFSDSYSAEIV